MLIEQRTKLKREPQESRVNKKANHHQHMELIKPIRFTYILSYPIPTFSAYNLCSPSERQPNKWSIFLNASPH